MAVTFLDFFRDRLTFDMATVRPVRFVNMLQLVLQVRRERRQLAALSPKELADMGIPHGAAKREAGRDLFDLPKSRLDEL